MTPPSQRGIRPLVEVVRRYFARASGLDSGLHPPNLAVFAEPERAIWPSRDHPRNATLREGELGEAPARRHAPDPAGGASPGLNEPERAIRPARHIACIAARREGELGEAPAR